MAIEVKEIADFLGIEVKEDMTVDQFKTAFGGEFVRKSAVKNDEKLVGEIVGSRMGALDVLVRRELKSAGVELDAETKDKKVEEIISSGISALVDSTKGKITELETQLANQDFNSEREQLTKANDQLLKKLESQKKTNQTLQQSFDEFKVQIETKEKNRKLNGAYESALASQSLKPGISDIEKEGFTAVFKSKYVIDFDENNEPAIFDKEKNPIPNPDKADSFLGIQDVMKAELINNNLHQKNPHQNPPAQPVPPVQIGAPSGGQGTGNQRQVHPAAQANAAKSE